MTVQQTSNLGLLPHSTCNDLGQQSPKSGRFQVLDHLRGIACLMIVICHATVPICENRRLEGQKLAAEPVAVRMLEASKSNDHRQPFKQITSGLVWLTSQMRFGVEMFFVISGFCIASSAISLLQSGRSFHEYFKRRFLRIFPTFWCAVIFSVFAVAVIESISPGVLGSAPWPLAIPWEMSVFQWFGSLTLTSTWIHYLTGEERLCFPNQSWSLCHEEQFYAMVGVLMLISGRRIFQFAAVVTAGITLVNLLTRYYGLHIRGFFFDEQWFMFAAGMGVYWCVNLATRQMAIVFQSFLAGAILGLVLLAINKPIVEAGVPFAAARLAGALIFALSLIWLYRFDAQIAGMNWLNWLKSCGLMSYSIYLIHLFPGKMISRQLMIAGFNDDVSTLLISIPLNLAAAIFLGYILFVSVERRFLKLRHHAGQEASLAIVQSERPDANQAANPTPTVLSLEVERELIRKQGRDREPERDSESRKSA